MKLVKKDYHYVRMHGQQNVKKKTKKKSVKFGAPINRSKYVTTRCVWKGEGSCNKHGVAAKVSVHFPHI